METTYRAIGGGEPLQYELQRLWLRSGREGSDAVVVAYGFSLRGKEFLVLRGSEAFVEEGVAFALAAGPADASTKRAREILIADGTLRREGRLYEFTRDVVFNSPSLAAGVVLGRRASGNEEWRDAEGTKLKDL